MPGAGLSTEGGSQHYDNPFLMSYGGFHDFGAAANLTTAVPVPKGRTRAVIVEIAVAGVEIFTAGGLIELGTAADPNRYASLAIGLLAATNGIGIGNAPVEPRFDIGNGLGVILIGSNTGQENITQIELNLEQTTGTPTGTGVWTVVIAWS